MLVCSLRYLSLLLTFRLGRVYVVRRLFYSSFASIVVSFRPTVEVVIVVCCTKGNIGSSSCLTCLTLFRSFSDSVLPTSMISGRNEDITVRTGVMNVVIVDWTGIDFSIKLWQLVKLKRYRVLAMIKLNQLIVGCRLLQLQTSWNVCLLHVFLFSRRQWWRFCRSRDFHLYSILVNLFRFAWDV
jgi:hypothetical protein